MNEVNNDVMLAVQETPVLLPITQEEPIKKKRGRKPNPNKPGNYFSDKEEAAVVQYCNSTDDIEKNRIYHTILHPAFVKMIESIIKRYMLFIPGETFEETRDATLANLITKLHYYNPNKKTKAYSYYGTLCKNYLIYERKKAQEARNQTYSYDAIYTEDNPDLRVTSPINLEEMNLQERLMIEMKNVIQNTIMRPESYDLNENDIKVGQALINILNDWEDIFQNLNSKKYNKLSVESYIREYTLLTTNEIRDSKKKYTILYKQMKDNFLNEINN
jgi:hypothetical protein